MSVGPVLGDATAATASLDRLFHHCTSILIAGESYRARGLVRRLRE